jgi:hypothetical protein
MNSVKEILKTLRDLIIESKEWEKEWDALYRFFLQTDDLFFLPILISKALRILEKDGWKLDDLLLELAKNNTLSSEDNKKVLAAALVTLTPPSKKKKKEEGRLPISYQEIKELGLEKYYYYFKQRFDVRSRS